MASERTGVEGCLLGVAVGDALGLPTEGLSRKRVQSFLGPGPLNHRFLLGKGMLSDDTEHACMTLLALAWGTGDPERFSRSLAWRLRGWSVCLPAGVGLATAKACFKLWMGVPPSRSGVRSAGNGPCMRAAVLGAALPGDRSLLLEYVDRSSRMTHRDARAVEGARIVAVAASRAREVARGRSSPSELLRELDALVETREWKDSLASLDKALCENWSQERFLREIGCEDRVGGYVLHSIPAALWCWLREPADFARPVEASIRLGGDTDTTASIVGGLAGAGLGPGAIPSAWIRDLRDWPRSTSYLRRLAAAFDRGQSLPALAWPAIPLRNLFFLAVVLSHGFRRLFRL